MKPKQFALLIRVIAAGFHSVVNAICRTHSNTPGVQHWVNPNECDTYYYADSEIDEANAEEVTP